ncbi:hypothetical protein [Limnospira platensis]|nr:hypothetical protein AP285_22005 [Arthrospira platensis YZ]KDR54850.1 hypothetical protein APPUASWS_027035 [Arthrospira platensis str. Paraca]MDF2207892.1 hypothetical protein [Arthrospira platensis NCB002]QQW28166.1 hypothetical protein AP9108_24280 [Arthrospira sp. PCC 9108]BAI92844.1 hypothetical protein NIES39_M00060 [Arthrospira platensis NIES-39]
MASPVTLNGPTLEHQLLEVIEQVQRAQINATRNPNGVTVVTAYTRNMATGAVTVSLTIPTDDVLDATNGSIDVEAIAVFVD